MTQYKPTNPGKLSPHDCRNLISRNLYTGPTAAFASGYSQANLVVLPKTVAEDFLEFAQQNPKPCPILEMTSAGDPHLTKIAHANIITDLPAYLIFENANLKITTHDLKVHWRDDLVSFVIGCSYTTDRLLELESFKLPHIIHNTTIPIYITNKQTQASRFFSGPLAVSMRYIPKHRLQQATEITNNYPLAHGAPIHSGDPHILGIDDITQPDHGTYYPPQPGDIPVFWACGITPQLCMQPKHITFMITHKPGHMLICDYKNTDLFQRQNIG